MERYDRWDRLGYKATQAYNRLLEWIGQQQDQRQRRLIPGVVGFLDRAIQTFYYGGNHLPVDQLTALRELMETAQHYWTVDDRLRQVELTLGRPPAADPHGSIAAFIALIRQGTVTANPFSGGIYRPQPDRGHHCHGVSVSFAAAQPPLALLARCRFPPLVDRNR